MWGRWVLLLGLVLSAHVHAATQYTYDALNRLTKVQYDDGRVIAYRYDAAGNLLNIDKVGPTTGPGVQLLDHFKFDNDLADSIAPRPALSLLGALSPTFTTRGTSGAIALPSGQYLANASGMLTAAMAADGNHSFSVATFVKFDAWAPQTNAIVYERAYGGADPCVGPTYGISNYYNFGGRKWLMLIATRNDQGACVNEQLWSTVDASLGQWYHVAATYDQTTGLVRLYVNGAVVAEKTIAKRLSLASNPYLSVGQQPWGGDQLIRGAIDDLRFYRGALSATEVAALVGTPSTPISISHAEQPAAYDNLGGGVAWGQTFVALDPSVMGLSLYLKDPSRPDDARVQALKGSFSLELYALDGANQAQLLARKLGFAAGDAGWAGLTDILFDQPSAVVAGKRYFLALRADSLFGAGLRSLTTSTYGDGAEAWLDAATQTVIEYPGGRDLAFRVLSLPR